MHISRPIPLFDSYLFIVSCILISSTCFMSTLYLILGSHNPLQIGIGAPTLIMLHIEGCAEEERQGMDFV